MKMSPEVTQFELVAVLQARVPQGLHGFTVDRGPVGAGQIDDVVKAVAKLDQLGMLAGYARVTSP